ncbi:MAG: MBL fold metallo-hydrolase [Candidatus Rifleibacteriota bacterium]
MIFEQFTVGNMENFSYLFADEESKEGFIVDPAHDHEKILRVVKQHSVNLTRILLTHHHYDHVNAAEAVKARTGAEIICHRETAALLRGNSTYDKLIDEGDRFHVGKDEVSCLHVPGHAPGSICLVVADKWLVTGDTMFIGDCGRADLAGGNIEELFASLQKIKQLPDHLIVCPGHNYGPVKLRTLGEEKRLSKVLLARNLEEFYKI